jgi:hypothetical protein
VTRTLFSLVIAARQLIEMELPVRASADGSPIFPLGKRDERPPSARL